MAMISFSNGTVADASDVNANFANSVALDTSRTVTVTHTWSAAQNFDAGTVSAPGIYLEGETGTGLYRIGANNHGYAVDGSKVLDIASTGLGVTGALDASGDIDTTSGGYQLGGTTIVTSGGALQNVTASAAILTSGNFGFARLPTGGGTWAVGGNLTLTGGSLGWGGGGTLASSDVVVTTGDANTWTDKQTFTGDVQVGSGGATITDILTGTASFSANTLSENESDSESATVTGAAVGDAAFVTQSANVNIVVEARVTSANTVSVIRHNVEASASPGAETLRVFVFKV